MNIHDLLSKAVGLAGATSARSLQTSVGPSELGGCRAKVWHRLNGTEVVNDTLSLASFMGTAIHTRIEDALRALDPWGDDFESEVTVKGGGITGHVDFYHKGAKAVVDWKTTTKKNLAYFPSLQQRWQVQVYGWLLTQSGREVETVTLVAIPRDGNERDIKIHTEAYDPQMAADALAWLEAVKDMTEPPTPEKDATFCKDYCPYFGVCPGLTRSPKDSTAPIITDADTLKALDDYVAAQADVKTAEQRLENAKTALEGVNGQTDKVTVSWSEVAGRQTVDEKAVEEALGFVPKKQGKGSVRLVVKSL